MYCVYKKKNMNQLLTKYKQSKYILKQIENEKVKNSKGYTHNNN